MTVTDIHQPDGGLSAPTRVRLAVLDHHELLLDSLGSWIAMNAPDFELVLGASTWLELVLSANFPTDLVFIDFEMQESISIEARVRTCRAAGAKVIVLSSQDTPEIRERALATGAIAFASKSLSMQEVMELARTAMGVTPANEPHDWRPRPIGATTQTRPKLSPGETQALTLYVSGLSTPEVANRMNVQYETAKTYLRRVREKYAKVNRPASKKAELARRAAEDGLLA